MTSPSTSLLFDTDFLIDYLRGRTEAVAYLDTVQAPLVLSVITIAELYAGVRDGDERIRLDSFVSVFGSIPLDRDIAITGGLYRRDYGKSHGIGLADTLIAATVTTRGFTLVTRNEKHFPMVSALVVPY